MGNGLASIEEKTREKKKKELWNEFRKEKKNGIKEKFNFEILKRK